MIKKRRCICTAFLMQNAECKIRVSALPTIEIVLCVRTRERRHQLTLGRKFGKIKKNLLGDFYEKNRLYFLG